MAIQVLELPFETDSLEPFMSKKAMETHYEKHYKKYVSTLNELILGSKFDGLSLEQIIVDSVNFDKPIFHNAAQAWNHIFFWNCITPKKVHPTTSLLDVLNKQFGSIEKLKECFEEAATTLFGSGWVWLVKNNEGTLSIKALKNADNPLTQDQTPLLVCDVWEHAYYLDYQNARPKYVNQFWDVINWNFVEANLMAELSHFSNKQSMPGNLVTAKEFEFARGSHH